MDLELGHDSEVDQIPEKEAEADEYADDPDGVVGKRKVRG